MFFISVSLGWHSSRLCEQQPPQRGTLKWYDLQVYDSILSQPVCGVCMWCLAYRWVQKKKHSFNLEPCMHFSNMPKKLLSMYLLLRIMMNNWWYRNTVYLQDWYLYLLLRHLEKLPLLRIFTIGHPASLPCAVRVYVLVGVIGRSHFVSQVNYDHVGYTSRWMSQRHVVKANLHRLADIGSLTNLGGKEESWNGVQILCNIFWNAFRSFSPTSHEELHILRKLYASR